MILQQTMPIKNQPNLKPMQLNIVYISSWPINVPIYQASTLYFSRYGTIKNVRKRFYAKKREYVNVFIVYSKQKEAALALICLNNQKIGSATICTYYGLGKYCKYIPICRKKDCVYVHQKDNPLMDLTQDYKTNNKICEKMALTILKQEYKWVIQMINSEHKLHNEVQRFMPIICKLRKIGFYEFKQQECKYCQSNNEHNNHNKEHPNQEQSKPNQAISIAQDEAKKLKLNNMEKEVNSKLQSLCLDSQFTIHNGSNFGLYPLKLTKSKNRQKLYQNILKTNQPTKKCDCNPNHDMYESILWNPLFHLPNKPN